MTRNANNSMRKLVMTGLAVCGMLIGGLGSVGCDEQQVTLAGREFRASTAQPTMDTSLDKADNRSLIWHPRR